MSDGAFEAAWRGFYPVGEPVGYRLRHAGIDYWQRFHSLPDSQRYAENDAEMSVILSRQNSLARHVLGEGGMCWMVECERRLKPGEVEVSDYDQPIRDYGLMPQFQFHDDEDDDWWLVRARLVTWRSGGFDPLLIDIANWKVSHLLWMSAGSGAVFAPYDGGVDLFLPTLAERTALKERYADWLSIHPSGL